MPRKSTILIVVTTYLLSSSVGWAAEPNPAAAPAAGEAATGGSAATAGGPVAADQLLTAGELEQLVAPIALYPDDLLATVLIAATYPLEVVQADRWARNNKSLKGDAIKKAIEKQPWDHTVKTLASTPQVLATMSEQIEWTQKLGDAVLAQQDDLMAAVQRLRLKAQEFGNLKSTKEQTVTVENVPAAETPQASGGGTLAPSQVIVIESAQPNVVSVPYYDPGTVYGGWSYPSYPPYYSPPPTGYYGYYPGWYPGRALATGVAFGLGVAWVGGVTGAFNWGNRNINIGEINIGSGNVRNRTNVRSWQHNPVHRGGVRYNNTQVANRFSNINAGAVGNRGEFRGRGEGAGGALGGAAGGALAGAAGGALAGAAGGALAGKAGADALKSKLGAGSGGNLANKDGGGNLANKAGGGKLANKAGGGKLANKASGGKLANKAGGGNIKAKAGGDVKAKAGGGAFNGVKQGGAKAKAYSARGKASMGGGGGRPAGGRGGGAMIVPRGGGGGRGGGRR
jgi:hypothetical protein